MEDEMIVELFVARSEQAITELSGKYEKLCAHVARNILKSSHDVEECINDTYLGVWNSIPPQRPKQLSAYVCRIMRNLAIKRYHSNTAIKRNSYYDVSLEELEECIPCAGSIEEEWESGEAARVIEKFLDTLKQENRVMFVRRYWFSESIPELSERFGLSEHTVSARLFRTREKMKKYLIREGVSI